jgi:hypothetical protein
MGIMGSSMVGSVAGQAVGNMMFGGKGESAPPAQAAAPAPGQYAAPAAPACSFESQQFLACMSQTGENMDQCRQFYDMFKLCSSQAQMQQYQQNYN